MADMLVCIDGVGEDEPACVESRSPGVCETHGQPWVDCTCPPQPDDLDSIDCPLHGTTDPWWMLTDQDPPEEVMGLERVPAMDDGTVLVVGKGNSVVMGASWAKPTSPHPIISWVNPEFVYTVSIAGPGHEYLHARYEQFVRPPSPLHKKEATVSAGQSE